MSTMSGRGGPRLLESVGARGGDADDGDEGVVCEQAAKALREHRVVVDNEDPCRRLWRVTHRVRRPVSGGRGVRLR